VSTIPLQREGAVLRVDGAPARLRISYCGSKAFQEVQIEEDVGQQPLGARIQGRHRHAVPLLPLPLQCGGNDLKLALVAGLPHCQVLKLSPEEQM
jgi:hypothetical protein